MPISPSILSNNLLNNKQASKLKNVGVCVWLHIRFIIQNRGTNRSIVLKVAFGALPLSVNQISSCFSAPSKKWASFVCGNCSSFSRLESISLSMTRWELLEMSSRKRWNTSKYWLLQLFKCSVVGWFSMQLICCESIVCNDLESS